MSSRNAKMRHNHRKPFNQKRGHKFVQRPNRQQPKKEYRNQNQLQEIDVGITEFISQLEGYSGIIKARFSDFQVNEIDLEGNVAKLTDCSIPKDFEKKTECLKDGEEPDSNSPIEQIPQNIWDDILKLLKEPTATVVEMDCTQLNKTERSQIHNCLKEYLPGKVFANTVNKDDKKFIVFKKNDGKNVDKRFKWPEDKGKYVHFLVYKECLDTLEATYRIADCLRISSSNIVYAGLKDKRAKTTQWFSIKQIEPWKLIVKTKSLRNIKIGNITFKDTPLKLGQLSANNFRIALRNVTGSDQLIEESLKSLSENGFINYYGLQRFGNNKEVPTFSIGVQLLLGNWKEACQIILKPTESDDPDFDVTKAKKVFNETGDAAKALEKFTDNRNTCSEYRLLSGLAKGHSNDFVTALENIPRNARLLYIHSFQSLIFNLAASKRVKQFGLKVVEGDLVLVDENTETAGDSNDDEKETSRSTKVKALTAEECDNYTMYDIVLPLPGYDVVYPENLKDFYKETLEKYGLTLEMEKQKVQTYTLSGDYRKLIGRIEGLTWKIMHYDDPNHNLIRSDFEELLGHQEPVDVENGKYKALYLEFILQSSSYATMVLREILKMDTSTSSNANLNKYHEEVKPKVTVDSSLVEPNYDEINNRPGLLADPAKYEAFKNIVFNKVDVCAKRKLEDGSDEGDTKVLKIDDSIQN